MTTREELRRDGAAMRARLFAAEAPRQIAGEIAPGLADLLDELTFGAVWRRPGPYNGLAPALNALAALSDVLRD